MTNPEPGKSHSMERASFALLLYLMVPVTLFAASHTPKNLRFLYAVLQLGIYFAVVLSIPPGSEPSSDYQFGTTFLSILSALNFFVLCDPYQDHWRTSPRRDTTSPGTTKAAKEEEPVKYAELDPYDSVLWCFANSSALRGIGWNWMVPHLPQGPAKGISRVSYLGEVITGLVKLYLLHDFSATILKTITSRGRTPLDRIEILPRAIAVVSFAVSSVTIIEIGYQLVCLVGAATGLFWTRYEDNHPVLGSVSDGYTISRFWGRVWHQNMRRVLQAPGKYLVQNVFNAKRGGLASRYIQSYSAFFLSGLYHYIAAQTSLPSAQFRRTWLFFLLQPNLILCEDFAIWIGREKLGLTSPRWKFLGYVWTYTTLIITSTGFVGECVMHRLVPSSTAFPFSLAERLIPS